MLRFVFQKMLSNRWMTACLLLGNLFLCAIAAAIPIYTDATMNRVLQRQLEELEETGTDPGCIRLDFTVRTNPAFEAMENGLQVMEDTVAAMGLPTRSRVSRLTSETYTITNLNARQTAEGKRRLTVSAAEGWTEHVTLLSGRLPEGIDGDGDIEAVITQRVMVEQDLIVGDEVELDAFLDPEGNLRRVRIVGVVAGDGDGSFWADDPEADECIALADYDTLYDLYVENHSVKNLFYRTVTVHLDTAEMDAKCCAAYTAATDALESLEDGNAVAKLVTVSAAFSDTVRAQTAVRRQLVTTLLILLVPVLLLLGFFVFMVSKQTLEQEKSTIAVLDSRGVSRGQIIGVYTIQSFVIALAAALLGIPLGFLLCRVLGSASGYMELVGRAALPVRLQGDTILCVLAAVAVSVLTMAIPAVLYANTSIVEDRRTRGTMKLRSVLIRMGVDLGLFGVSLYGWYTFHNQMDALTASGETGIDPLILLSSSLFLISAGLFFSLLIPLAERLIFHLGRNHWRPGVYTAFLRVIREGNNQRFLMVFLVLTVAIGIFNARTARTLNRNLEENIYYTNGAQLTLQQTWKVSGGAYSLNPTYETPDESGWDALLEAHPEIRMARVYDSRDYAVGTLSDVRVMGIETADFAETAWMRDGLLPTHWYNYLNALSLDPSAVLLSMNWHTELGYELGDTILLRSGSNQFLSATIYGFVDYWPGYTRTTEKVISDTKTETVEEYLVVANLSQLQASWGTLPYGLWFSGEDLEPVYRCIEDNAISISALSDADEAVRSEKREPVLQGVNGLMTVSFLVVLLVCMTGFLIFWLLSVRGRTMLLGTLRAMGLSMGELTGMLLTEQILITLTSAGAGFLVGWGASGLFAHLIQLSFSASFSALPLEVHPAGGDVTAIAIVLAVLFTVTMVLLVRFVRRISLTRAIHRGED